METYLLLFLSLFTSLALNDLTYPLILGNIKTNDLITLSKYSIKHLELVFVLTNFEITILSTLTSEKCIGLNHKIFLLLLLFCQISTLGYVTWASCLALPLQL